MYGSNEYGTGYYGQGPAEGTTFILKSVSATVTALATISSVLLINKAVTATVVAVATIRRQFNKNLTATAVTVGSLLTEIFDALNIRRASTKMLNLLTTTRAVSGFDRETVDLNPRKTTKIITTE